MKINNQQILSIDSEDEAQFRWKGCDNCANSLGNTVYECRAHTWDDHYEIYLCGSCLCAYHNGDELDDECRNIFEV